MSIIQLSILICTKDRPVKINNAILSVLASSKDFNVELVIIDQSASDRTKLVIEGFKDARIRYFHTSIKGLSKARNLSIQLALSDVVAFTDDDCQVDANWVSEILHTFKNNPGVLAVFGRTLAYRPSNSSNITYETRISPFGTSSHAVMDNMYACRSLIIKEEACIFNYPCTPSENIGSSNNFAARSELFTKAGIFLEQLGAGSWINGGEDTEIIYRWLRRGYKIMYEPTVVVYHDSWLNKSEEQRILDKYTKAAISVFFYYRLHRDALAGKVLRYRWNRIVSAYTLRNFSRTNNKPLKEKNPLPFIRGLVGGLYLYLRVDTFPRPSFFRKAKK